MIAMTRMTVESLSQALAGLGPALWNHLWQSTLFAAAVGLLILALRKNRARVRYGLWLAASMKFLIPFSLLASLGGLLGWLRPAPGIEAGTYQAIEHFSAPFAGTATPAVSSAIPSAVPSTAPAQVHWLPIFLAAMWVCGFLVVLFAWYRRWRRISEIARAATPLETGREVEALRRVASAEGFRKPIEIRLSQTSLEPGIFGIARSVLLWPAGLSGRLDDAQLDAIIAHELEHVRRRDNLAATLCMLVEAMFWFYPLTWWLGARALEERERACDEEVVERGSPAQAYAEGILKVCEFCLASPLSCVSGVSGADLKKRVAAIMARRVAHKLDFGRKLLLVGAVILTVGGPVAFGFVNVPGRIASPPAQGASKSGSELRYASVSIRPFSAQGRSPTLDEERGNGFKAHVTAADLFERGYRTEGLDWRPQVSGAPAWFYTQKYYVETKMAPSVRNRILSDIREQWYADAQMTRNLLADRFKLRVHRVTEDLPVYFLTIAEGGAKLKKVKADRGEIRGVVWADYSKGTAKFSFDSVADIALFFSKARGRPVVDKTGLKGVYDFTLHAPPGDPQSVPISLGMPPGNFGWGLPERGMRKRLRFAAPAGGCSFCVSFLSRDVGKRVWLVAPKATPALASSIGEQLGLKLVPGTGPVTVYVIDHIEKPSLN